MAPEDILAELAERHGFVLTDGGPGPGGEVGARYASGPDGEGYVYKWSEGPSDPAPLRAMVERVARLRDNGYPAPRSLAPFELGRATVLVQERMDGVWCDDVDDDLVQRLLDLNELQAGLGEPGTAWGEYMAHTLTVGADGYCVHASLRDRGGEVAELLGWIEAVGQSLGPLLQQDLVHLDFHHRNILRSAAGGLAVVDLGGCQPGDRAFDLVTFCLHISHATARPGVEEPKWSRATELASAEALRAYVAHMALRRLDWTLRFYEAPELDRVLPVVRRYVDRVR